MSDIIGYLVFYTARFVKIRRDAFNKMLADEGFEIFVKKGKPLAAFFNAQSEVKKKSIGRQWHFVKLKEENFRRWYGIFEAKRTKLWDDIEIKQTATMEFNARTGELTCDWPHKSFLYFKEMYTYYCEGLCYEDIHSWFLRILENSAAVSLRDGGIIYFFPKEDEKIVTGCQTVFANTPKRCSFVALPQIRSKMLSKTVNKHLFGLVAKRALTYRDWIFPRVRTIDISDVDNRLTTLYNFKRMLEIYKDITEFEAKPFLDFTKEAIKRYRARREEINIKSPTQLQKIKYLYNQKRYPDEE